MLQEQVHAEFKPHGCGQNEQHCLVEGLETGLLHSLRCIASSFENEGKEIFESESVSPILLLKVEFHYLS